MAAEEQTAAARTTCDTCQQRGEVSNSIGCAAFAVSRSSGHDTAIIITLHLEVLPRSSLFSSADNDRLQSSKRAALSATSEPAADAVVGMAWFAAAVPLLGPATVLSAAASALYPIPS